MSDDKQSSEFTLPGSGTIAMSQIKGEFNKGNNLGGYYGAASGVPSSGAIKYSDFYGKSSGGGNPGLLPGLTPTFGSPASQAGGFVVQVTNYDANYSWSASSTAGTASVRSNGYLNVDGLSSGQSATVTVTTSRSGYNNGSASVTGTADSGTIEPPPPGDTAIDSTISGGSFTTSNGKKIGTITNTGAEGCLTINKVATGAYSNNLRVLYVGAGGGGGGGGRAHQYESNGSVTGGGGGAGGLFTKPSLVSAGQKYCGRPSRRGWRCQQDTGPERQRHIDQRGRHKPDVCSRRRWRWLSRQWH